MTLEICANSLQSALIAQEAGAHRIELCENLDIGGTTPSYGQIAMARKLLQIKLYVLIRPRAGDFLYSDLEFEVMKTDVRNCKRLTCDGVVIGLLHADGHVDYERTKELVDLAAPMEVTFHRAFDRCKDPSQAIESIIKTGCKRILTSGMKRYAIDGIENIADFVEQADGRITIMPGSGLNSSNICEIKVKSGAVEFHTSAKTLTSSKMKYRNADLINEKSEWMLSGATEIKKILKRLES